MKGITVFLRSQEPLLISEAISHLLSVCFFPGRSSSSRVLGPFAPSHRPHLHSFFLGAGGLRLAALAVQSLLWQAATANAPLPLESLSEHSPHPYDLPISQKSGHTLQFAPLPPTPANTRSRAWPSQAREARPPACTCTRRALRGIDASSRSAVCGVPCFVRALFCSVHGNVTVSSCVRNIRPFSFRKI